MTLGGKIQKLRKESGLSQEQLAESLDVSRQALSKWELNAATPSVDKIVLLSDFFKVSTDYLLKDEVENQAICIKESKRTINQQSVLVISSAIVLVGLIVGWARGNDGTNLEYLSFALTAPGLIIQVIGIAYFEIFNLMHKNNGQGSLRYLFYGINVWFFAVLPTIFIVGRLFKYVVHSYPGFLPIQYMVMVYFMISVLGSLLGFWGYRKTYRKMN